MANKKPVAKKATKEVEVVGKLKIGYITYQVDILL
jgi:hypothetical protein